MAVVDYKLEGDKLIVTAGLETGVDQDKDGAHSVKVAGQIVIEIDGSEVVDELVKSSELVAKLKEKLGL